MREEGRERKESLVACGSRRDCWDRKESRPMIGAELVLVISNRRTKMVVAEPAIFAVAGFGVGDDELGEILTCDL